MSIDENRAYLAKRVEAKGGTMKASIFYGISYFTLASILNGNRSMGEVTLQRIKKADPKVNEHKLRAIKNYKGNDL